MRQRRTFNPKRRMLAVDRVPALRPRLQELLTRVRYRGSPEHKRNPGDFGLSPPSQPRQGKTLCDSAGVFARGEAENLLREGIRRGLVSVQERKGWPQNIWAVTTGGVPLEAELENPDTGSYHGYPMPIEDAFRQEVLNRWAA